MTMTIALRLLFAMASLPNIKIASSYGQKVWRPVVAFVSVSRNGPSRHHLRDARRRPSAIPSSSLTMQHQPVVSNFQTEQFALPRSLFAWRSLSTQRFTTADDDGSSETDGEGRTCFDIPLLRKETMRLALRAHKKIEKASARIRGAEEQYNKLRAAIDASPSDKFDERLLQQMEQAPNVEQYKKEMSELQHRLRELNWLEEQFNKPPLKSKKQLTIDEMAKLTPEGARVVQYVLELDIDDDESLRLKKIEVDVNNKRAKAEKAVTMKEENNQQHGGRLPYRRYYSQQRTEIRVSELRMLRIASNEIDAYCALCV